MRTIGELNFALTTALQKYGVRAGFEARQDVNPRKASFSALSAEEMERVLALLEERHGSKVATLEGQDRAGGR